MTLVALDTSEERLRAADRRKELYRLSLENPAAISDEEFAALPVYAQKMILENMEKFAAGLQEIINGAKRGVPR